MSFVLSQSQCFFLFILGFAVIGFQRGWKRELVSMGFSLGAVLFLFLGGGNGLANFIFVKLPAIAQVASGTASNGGATNVNTSNQLITTVITFLIVIIAGYWIGNKAFPRPTTPHERLMGILPAMVAGYFIMLYLTRVLFSSNVLTLGVNAPTSSDIGGYILIIVVLGIVVSLAALIAASAKKKK
jgi:hypothetical protein